VGSGHAKMQCYIRKSETPQNSVAHSTIPAVCGLMKFRRFRIENCFHLMAVQTKMMDSKGQTCCHECSCL
jgi:hypothetical protein